MHKKAKRSEQKFLIDISEEAFAKLESFKKLTIQILKNIKYIKVSSFYHSIKKIWLMTFL